MNDELSSVAKRTVAGEQSGFVEVRSIADNLVEMQGSLFEYSQLLDSVLAIVLFGFAQAFPRLAHIWIWLVLTTMGINSELIGVIECLCGDIAASVFHNGQRLHSFLNRAGIKQDCKRQPVCDLLGPPDPRAFVVSGTANGANHALCR